MAATAGSPADVAALLSAAEAITIKSRAELEQKFGDVLQGMADQHPTPYRLRAAMEKMSPSVSVSDGVLTVSYTHLTLPTKRIV